MDFDIRQIMDAWPFDPERAQNNYRIGRGADGRLLVQVREPLGIQQMEYDGRPDGARPEGHATWLDYYQSGAAQDPELRLDSEDMRRLMAEGILFYQRYLVLFHLEDWDGVVRDTQRNLTYFEFLRAHAGEPDQALAVEQYRPYVLRMNGVARAQLLWRAGRLEAALELLRGRMQEIRGLEAIPTPIFKAERERALEHLKDLMEELQKETPQARIELLRREQREAILREDFERAALLRDHIRRLEGEPVANN